MEFYNLNKKLWQWLTLIGIALVWGSSFILMKKGLRSFDYMQVAALRIFIAFLVLMPLYFKSIKKISRQNIMHILLAGYAGIFFPAFLFTKAQTQINSSLAGMINSLAPFFALVIGILLYKRKPGRNQYLGILIGLLGALSLISNGNILTSFQGINYFALYVVVAAVCYGINANEVAYKLKSLNGLEVTVLGFLFTGPPAGVYLFFSDLSTVFSTRGWAMDFFYIVLLAVVGSVITLYFFNSLLQHTTAIFATSVTYLIPFFAISWGFFDGEKITLMQIISILLALIGVWLVNKRTV